MVYCFMVVDIMTHVLILIDFVFLATMACFDSLLSYELHGNIFMFMLSWPMICIYFVLVKHVDRGRLFFLRKGELYWPLPMLD